MSTSSRLSRREGGQAIAILTVAAVALLAMVALVVDGGNAFTQQRVTQNAADASSEAGAVVLMRKLAGVSGMDGSVVDAKLQASAASNGLITPVKACYTDIVGHPLATDGSQAADCASAAQVGPGLPIPPCAGCPGTFASGVEVHGDRSFTGFFGGIVGLNGGTASAKATAIAGYVTGLAAPVIPLTFPVFALGCDGTNHPISSTDSWPVQTLLSLPLCSTGPGNVGWLDWTPTAGGASELAGAILGSPPNPPIFTPRWYYVTSTGNVNSGQVQASMDSWNGSDILLPIFSETCDGPPQGYLTKLVGEVADCVAGGNNLGGNGSNQYYYLVGFATFHLQASYINGGDGGYCNAYDLNLVAGGNGSTSCLVGSFPGPINAVSLGASVGAGGGSDTSTSLVGVQLIR